MARLPSRDSFAKMLLQAVKQGGAPRARYDKTCFRLVLGKNEFFNLATVYQEFCATPTDKRKEVVERLARAAIRPEIPRRFDEAFPNLIPRIRERFFFERLRLGPPRPLAYTVLADHFAVALSYDSPDSIDFVGPDRLKQWDVSLDDAVERSLENLRAMTTRPLSAVRPGLYRSDWGDNHDASRALLLDYLLRHKVEGEPVVAVPDRDVLLLTGSRDEAGLKEMAELMAGGLQGPRPMSGIPLVLTEGSLAPFIPDPGMPAFAELKMLRVWSLMRHYQDQKGLLETAFAREGRNLQVAPFIAAENPETKLPQSMTRWDEGVPSLLPEADRIAFVRKDPKGQISNGSPIIMADGSQVRERLGALMKREEYYPTLYRVGKFPSSKQIDAVAD
jgi:uncharacterized protein YtpQ (UPF0354 family)